MPWAAASRWVLSFRSEAARGRKAGEALGRGAETNASKKSEGRDAGAEVRGWQGQERVQEVDVEARGLARRARAREAPSFREDARRVRAAVSSPQSVLRSSSGAASRSQGRGRGGGARQNHSRDPPSGEVKRVGPGRRRHGLPRQPVTPRPRRGAGATNPAGLEAPRAARGGRDGSQGDPFRPVQDLKDGGGKGRAGRGRRG